MYDTIVVPTDGSEHAMHMAKHAAALARAFDVSIHAVHVVDLQTEGDPFAAGGVDDEFVKRLETEGQTAIDAVEDRRGMAGREVPSGVLHGRPSEAILDYAADSGADFIAMGPHGRTGVRRYVVGA